MGEQQRKQLVGDLPRCVPKLVGLQYIIRRYEKGSGLGATFSPMLTREGEGCWLAGFVRYKIRRKRGWRR